MLLNSTSDIKKFFGTLAKNTAFATIKPFVEQAKQKYLVPALGSEILAELETGVKVPAQTPGLLGEVQDVPSTITLTAHNLALYQLVAASLAYYTILEAMPFLNVSIGNLGTQEQQVNNMVPVRQWTYFQSEQAAAENADRFLDQALAYLEKNVELFPTWSASEAYTISHSLLIPDTATLSRFMNIQNSRRAFLALKPFQERATDLYILPEIGEELTEILKGSALTPDQRKIKFKAQQALAQFTLAEALPEIALQLTGSGLRVLSDNDSIRQRLAASESQIGSLSAKALQLAQVYMADLRRLLDFIIQHGETNPADLKQTWEAPDNSNSASFWV